MSTSRNQAFGLTGLALLQLLVAIVLLYWALPLFLDPPVLSLGIASASRKLTELSVAHPDGFKHIGWAPKHLQWLFSRHTEGVLMALVAATALIGSSLATLVFARALTRNAHRNASQRT